MYHPWRTVRCNFSSMLWRPSYAWRPSWTSPFLYVPPHHLLLPLSRGWWQVYTQTRPLLVLHRHILNAILSAQKWIFSCIHTFPLFDFRNKVLNSIVYVTKKRHTNKLFYAIQNKTVSLWYWSISLIVGGKDLLYAWTYLNSSH